MFYARAVSEPNFQNHFDETTHSIQTLTELRSEKDKQITQFMHRLAWLEKKLERVEGEAAERAKCMLAY